MNFYDWSNLVALALFSIGLAIFIIQYRRCHNGDSVAWITVMVHGILYCAVFFIDYRDGTIDPAIYNLWSIVLRYHTIMIAIAVGMYHTWRTGMRHNGC